MKLSRPSRLIAAVMVLFSVLFSQIAIAAYACPGMQIAQAMASIAAPSHMDAMGEMRDMGAMPGMTATAGQAAHQEMPGCTGMDSDQQVSCPDYGQVRNLSLDKPAMPDVQPFVASAILQTINPAAPLFELAAPPASGLPLSRSTAPPLAIRHCCFRI